MGSMIIYGDGRNLKKGANIIATLHLSGLYDRVARLKLLLTEETRQPTWNLQKST